MALLSLIALIVGIYFFRKKLNPKNRTTNTLIVFGVVGFKGHKVWVQIVDIAVLVKTNKWEKIGESRCL